MDDWEDAADDFVYQAPVQAAVKTIWDDEEEEVVVAKVGPSAAQVEAAAKKAKEEEIRMSNVLKFAILEDETPEEKKARERKQIEDADAELAGELFGGGKVSGTTAKAGASFSTGIAAATVKTKADHTNFGILCAKKLGDSNSFNIGAFYKTLTEKVQKNLTLETCDEMLALLTKIREEKKLAEPVKVAAVAKKSKAQLKAETKRHTDVFGGADSYDDRFDEYNNLEDDYM